MFEVKSILGDDLDLIGQGLFLSTRSQYTITISQIEKIKVRSISAIGELN